jgi:hypothetical protein
MKKFLFANCIANVTQVNIWVQLLRNQENEEPWRLIVIEKVFLGLDWL